MLINVLDVNLQKVAFLSNDVPGLPNYYDDEFHEYRDQGAATFKFTVKKVINNKLQSYARFLNGQSYFSFQIDGNDYLMTPASEQAIHETSEEISFFCVSLDRELMSEQANPLVNTSSHNIQWYFDQMGLISNTQITIGINEVSNLTRTINYDGQETKLARLVSVIGNFDAEFEFITKLNNDGSLGSVTLNIYKENDGLNIQGVGKKRDDVRLIFGENIQAIERDVSTEGFLNATTVTGADNLNWNSASFSYINADGVEEFYKRAGSDTAFAPLSAKIYPAQLSKDKDDIWTRIDFTTEYKNVNDMWAYAVRQFKQYAYHQVTYTVTPSSKLVNAEIGDGPPLAKGDTVIIQDNNYIDIDGNVGLLLSARVSEKIVSETHPENNKLIFSNYKKLKSEVSTDIQAIVNQLVDAATPFRAELSTTNGTQFKNGTGSTTLSAHIFKGSATTETVADSYEWSKDGMVVANAQTITVDASGVANKAVYSFKATVAGKVVASQSVTITNVNDGVAGKDGVGLINTTLRYAKSKDGVNKPEGRIVASFTDKFIPARSIIDNLIMTGKQVHLEQGKTYILSAETNGVFTNVHNVEQSNNNATIWIVNPSFSTWDIISDTNTAIGTKYTHNRPTGDYEIRINSYVIDNSIWVKNIVFEDGTWTPDIPVANPGEYLWTRTTWFYSDGTNETGFSVSKMGDQGIPGPKGADGKTQYTHIAYANSADGKTEFSTSDSNRTYIGMYVDFNINDSTTPSDYSWTLVKGADGTQGTPGKPGADGKTPYFHTAWAYSSDGNDRFTTVYPSLNLLKGTRVPISLTGKNETNQRNFLYWFDNGENVQNQGLSVGDTLTCTFDWTVTNPASGTFLVQLNEASWQYLSQTISITSGNSSGHSEFSFVVDYNFLSGIANGVQARGDNIPTDSVLTISNFLFTKGSTAIPHMPSASEVTTADWPSYIGQYTDFTQADSTNPSDYTWSLIRGNDGKDGANGKDGRAGKDGVGIKTTVITYAISISGTTAPSTGWTSSVPTLVKGQYLWTKTVWTYTDNSIETGYSVTYIAKDGNNGNDGIAGKDGTGIKTTTITYAGSTSGTTAPSSGWTSTIPTVAAGSYLWTKTVWVYTDNTSETGYSVAKMGNTGATGPQGPQGNTGPQGPAGSNGDPGKIVSDTEPSTRFKGLTWKYSGTSDLTASDGTVIKPNTEYYYNGTHWMINYLSANNLEANSIKADKIDAKNLTITDGEFVSTTTNGPVTTSTEIKDNHIAISKTDGTVNTKNDLAVDTEQGFAMKFTNNTTGLTREASVNFQGVSTSDSNGNYAQLTPQGTKLSTDVPWTDITRASGVGTSGTLRARINNGVFYAQSKDVTIPSIAPNSLITIGTMSSKFSGVSGFDTLGLLYSLGQLSVASVTVGNDGKINIGNPNPTTMSGKVIQFSINIPLG
ncbi:hypothetical protein QUF05_05480 [Lactococcus lactis]|uniref:hypothetical protein n=4 Tax=Bacteria TaxID=2 RepID=UPI0025A2A8AB|nr:hypothetical protein [Lactococcus lactis]MDM7651122.1 hypothetical protein [Lactococcus lactis]